jgi:ParB/RepB/Spo0J family partition protein
MATKKQTKKAADNAKPENGLNGSEANQAIQSPQVAEQTQLIPVSLIFADPNQPRQYTGFDDDSIKELAESIKENGLLQPISVRPGEPGTPAEGSYILVMGERRFRACKMAGFETVPAFVRTMDEDKTVVAQIIENLQRKDVSAWEEAKSYQAALKTLKSKTDPSRLINAKELAAMLGITDSMIYKKLKLAKLSHQPAIDALKTGKLDYSYALILARLEPNQQEDVFEWLTEADYTLDEDKFTGEELEEGTPKKTLAELKDYVVDLYVDMDNSNWDKTTNDLTPHLPVCDACPARTKNMPDFHGKDFCTRKLCYEQKEKAFVRRRLAECKESDGKSLVAKKGYGSGIIVQGKEFRNANENKTKQFDLPVVVNETNSSHEREFIGKVYYISSKELEAKKSTDKTNQASNRINIDNSVQERAMEAAIENKNLVLLKAVWNSITSTSKEQNFDVTNELLEGIYRSLVPTRGKDLWQLCEVTGNLELLENYNGENPLETSGFSFWNLEVEEKTLAKALFDKAFGTKNPNVSLTSALFFLLLFNNYSSIPDDETDEDNIRDQNNFLGFIKAILGEKAIQAVEQDFEKNGRQLEIPTFLNDAEKVDSVHSEETKGGLKELLAN